MHLSSLARFVGLVALAAAQRARKSAPFTAPFQHYTQKIDHSNPTNGTFLQTYQLDTTYFLEGNLFFFFRVPKIQLRR